jgi:hypothetical protein
VFIDTEPKDLLGLLENHTDVQGQKLIADYLGKWLRVSGQVVEVKVMTKDTIYV